jgi:hypothetical protein
MSQGELLAVLAQARAPQAVQPHVAKCFGGIRRLDFGDDPKSTDIHAMLSGARVRARALCVCVCAHMCVCVAAGGGGGGGAPALHASQVW